MGTPFLSEIRIFSFNYAPQGWALCNGQTLAINQNQALFALLGTTYGGNGTTTFELPNLQGRVPLHFSGGSYPLGQSTGEQNHTLSNSEMPAHVHTMNAANVAATLTTPTGNALAEPVTQVGNIYGPATTSTTMAPQAINNTGGSQPHNNMQPYLVLNFCIALVGIFPSQN
jgi:microcystin-dependent protein